MDIYNNDNNYNTIIVHITVNFFSVHVIIIASCSEAYSESDNKPDLLRLSTMYVYDSRNRRTERKAMVHLMFRLSQFQILLCVGASEVVLYTRPLNCPCTVLHRCVCMLTLHVSPPTPQYVAELYNPFLFYSW